VSVFAAGDTTQFVNQIDTLATKIADTVSAVVFGFQKLYVLTSDRAILASFNPFDDYEKNALAAIEAAEKAAKFRRNMPSSGYLGSQPMGIYETSAQIAARKNAEAAAAKRARELAALQKKTLDTQKQSLALQKASKTLNLEAIGIEAALKGQISETDRLSLLLQKSILEGNSTLATSLSDQLGAAVKQNNDLQAALLATPEAPNPYRNWTIPADLLNYTAVSLGVSPETVINAPQTIAIPTEDPLREIFDAVMAAQVAQDKADAAAKAAEAIVNVNVQVGAEDVAAIITQQQTNQSLSGSFNTVNRVDRFRTLPI
jgi:hypothetical protein